MRRLSSFFFLFALALLLTACGSGKQAVPPSETNQVEQEPSNPNSPVQEIQGASTKLTVYYSDSDLTKLVTEERVVNYSDDTEKYEAAIALLGESDEEGHFPLWKNFAYHSLSFKDGVLTIDAKGDNQYNLGSGGEAFAIDALKQTLFQFSEVEKIRILVDGKPAESLMGHVSIDDPITRD
ncbi:GerMN domain-containing protein [Brevibacillus sp. B_LB10_24]|uniref:GerMN domain-containing protein n=1 Tax=Brevibacillus sp. B_LB10_24 TaxID=3380645 RepID=UPI0038BCCEAC